MTNRPWYAVAVNPRRETAVAHALSEIGIVSAVPRSRSRREFPLFPGYVFATFGAATQPLVLSTPGVTSIAGGAPPMPLPDDQIASIRAIMAASLPAMPHPYPGFGQLVRIERGSLAGVRGVLVRQIDSLLVVVSIGLIRRSAAVEIDHDHIAALQGAAHAPMASLYLAN